SERTREYDLVHDAPDSRRLLSMSNDRPARTGALRLITYLSPGLPLELFEDVGAYLEEELDLVVTLAAETATSAPPRDEPDPFSMGSADLGFLCAPGYCWLAERTPPAVRLVKAQILSSQAVAGFPCLALT